MTLSNSDTVTYIVKFSALLLGLYLVSVDISRTSNIHKYLILVLPDFQWVVWVPTKIVYFQVLVL